MSVLMHDKRIIMNRLLLFVATTCLFSACASAQDGLTPRQAAQHVGERATVCGTVASTHYAATTGGKPTFVNLDKPWPHPIFTLVIWGNDRPRFNPSPDHWTGRLCVTGRIVSYDGEPEIKVSTPAQIRH